MLHPAPAQTRLPRTTSFPQLLSYSRARRPLAPASSLPSIVCRAHAYSSDSSAVPPGPWPRPGTRIQERPRLFLHQLPPPIAPRAKPHGEYGSDPPTRPSPLLPLSASKARTIRRPTPPPELASRVAKPRPPDALSPAAIPPPSSLSKFHAALAACDPEAAWAAFEEVWTSYEEHKAAYGTFEEEWASYEEQHRLDRYKDWGKLLQVLNLTESQLVRAARVRTALERMRSVGLAAGAFEVRQLSKATRGEASADAYELFDEVEARGEELNARTFASLIAGLGVDPTPEKVLGIWDLLDRMDAGGVAASETVLNAAAAAMAKLADTEGIERLIKRYGGGVGRGVGIDEHRNMPHGVCWALIEAHGIRKRYTDILRILDGWAEAGVEMDKYTHATAVRHLGVNAGYVEAAERVFWDPRSRSSIAENLAKRRKYKLMGDSSANEGARAEEGSSSTFTARHESASPDHNVEDISIVGPGHAPAMKPAAETESIATSGQTADLQPTENYGTAPLAVQRLPDRMVCHALLMTYATARDRDSISNLLAHMRKYGPPPTSKTYNLLISGAVSRKSMHDAETWFDAMVWEGHRPTEYTFLLLWRGCRVARMFGAVDQLTQRMLEYGVKPVGEVRKEMLKTLEGAKKQNALGMGGPTVTAIANEPSGGIENREEVLAAVKALSASGDAPRALALLARLESVGPPLAAASKAGEIAKGIATSVDATGLLSASRNLNGDTVRKIFVEAVMARKEFAGAIAFVEVMRRGGVEAPSRVWVRLFELASTWGEVGKVLEMLIPAPDRLDAPRAASHADTLRPSPDDSTGAPSLPSEATAPTPSLSLHNPAPPRRPKSPNPRPLRYPGPPPCFIPPDFTIEAYLDAAIRLDSSRDALAQFGIWERDNVFDVRKKKYRARLETLRAAAPGAPISSSGFQDLAGLLKKNGGSGSDRTGPA
ncbi:hypothetical protein BDK51DRAFT_48411 [Blyttiomyces helicus]|uniref:Pentacotripeptide-repeat region of PRORP domain-containing protein n=1 Tax=Blyttiomyces helicus TaxID=388810 RepID=A0A4P9WLG5_9FUNG|nr:hypothetical protein BDK51DRAFT_48411 [Blyttiomyces helicus]|eukprot:RKO92923.1 hypothetical protein BDK51DRAFT_48411 [Blyttiomyces helicus]